MKPGAGFTHLHVQSYYSFLRGMNSPQALAQAAAQLGFTSLALTDHHSLTGAIEFYDACRDLELHPILGLEIKTAPPPKLATAPEGVLVVLAMDMQGWASLCRLASAVEIDNGNISFERLQENSEGLICLSGGRRGGAAKLAQAGQRRQAQALLRRLAQTFPNRFYVELQRHDETDKAWVVNLAALAEALDLPTVATHDVHYLAADEEQAQKVVTAARLNQPLAEEELIKSAAAPPGAALLGLAVMANRFADQPDALESTVQIAEHCQLVLPLGKAHFPEIELPPGQSALAELRNKAIQGAKKIYAQPGGRLSAAVSDRIEHELAVINETGYAPLFLIMEDILAYARRENVLFASRGSAASSLVAHCLGITTPDPMAHNLYFERFLNPARHSPPDIDTDLCSRRREQVIRYVYKRFGEERVATVCTVNRLRRRSALRAAAKAYNLAPETISRLVNALPHRWFSPAQRGEAEEKPYEELEKEYPDQREVFAAARALIGQPSHLSVHPGGIVISPGPLTDLAPLQLAAKGVIITQFDLKSIERLGLVKIDLLGIRGLTVLAEAGEAIQPEINTATLLERLETIPDQDEATSEMLALGKTIGCFQIESPGMRATLREIHARNEADILVALALYRPGPLKGGLKDAFVQRHGGLETTEYLHPALKPLLQDTYGVILYQEQVLRIAHELAGLSLADSDLLRRAMSHFDPGKQMQTLQEKFLEGIRTRHGITETIGQKIWALMAAFAGYGFPKAHAASYAQLGWRLAWCKAHLPGIFMAAVLANWGGYYPQRVYLSEARRMGLASRPPHVNFARREFSLQHVEGEPVLFMGLDQVRDLSQRTLTRIIQQQPFHSLDDFLARVDPRSGEAENLAKIGSLAGFGTIPGLLRRIALGGWMGGQLSLFPVAVHEGEDWVLSERAAAQQAVLGASLDAHPLDLIADKVAGSGAISTDQAATRLGERVRLAGVRHTGRPAQLRSGERVYLLALDDPEGMLDVTIPRWMYERHRAVISTNKPFLVEGVIERDADTGEPNLRAERIAAL
jgi:DNA polymerase III subunit alpha